MTSMTYTQSQKHQEYVEYMQARNKSKTSPKRTFSTGAMRDTDTDKLDFEGFLSPAVLEAFAHYMHKNRQMADGSLRASDNWQKGTPQDVYMKSLWRHFFNAWKVHRGLAPRSELPDALAGVLFNAMGYWFEELKKDKEA